MEGSPSTPALRTNRRRIHQPTFPLDSLDTLDGRYGKSLYIALIGDFPEEVSNPSNVSRGGEGVGSESFGRACYDGSRGRFACDPSSTDFRWAGS